MKKLLALVLALVMSMSLVTISNAAFKDESDISYKEAVDVMNAVGVLKGYTDGSFGAKDTLTRAQAAKIIAYLDLGEATAEAFIGTGSYFTDVPASHWAAGYIEYCAQAGYVAGVGDKKFAPDEKVTGYQFAKMLLCVLGYNAKYENLNGADWQINTAKLAADNDLFKGIEVKGSVAYTREQAAQMGLNALKATMVDYSGEGVTVKGDGFEVITSTPKSYVVTGTGAKAQAISNKQPAGSTTYTIELGEKLYDGKLKLTTGNDDFGAPANIWTYNNNEVIKSAKDAAITFTAKTKASDVAKAMSGIYFGKVVGSALSTVKIADTGIASMTPAQAADSTGVDTAFITSSKTDGTVGAITNTADYIATLTADGKKVAIYTNSSNIITNIVTVEYTLAEVTKVATNAKGDVTYTLTNSGSGTVYADPDTKDSIKLNGTVAKGDYVTFVKFGGVSYVYPTTSFTGKQSAFTSDGDLTINGTKYHAALGVKDAAATYILVGAFSNTDETSTYYADQFGFIVKSTAKSVSTDYTYIVGADTKIDTTVDGKTPSVQVRAVLADGTVGVYTVATEKLKSSSTKVGQTATNEAATLAVDDYIIKGTNILLQTAAEADKTASAKTSLLSIGVYGYTLSDKELSLEALNETLDTDKTTLLTSDAADAAAKNIDQKDTSVIVASGNTVLLDKDVTIVVYDSTNKVAKVYTGTEALSSSTPLKSFKTVVSGESTTLGTAKIVYATVAGGLAAEVSNYVYVNKNDVTTVLVDGKTKYSYEALQPDGSKLTLVSSDMLSANGLYQYAADNTTKDANLLGTGTAVDSRFQSAGTMTVTGNLVSINGHYFNMANAQVVYVDEDKADVNGNTGFVVLEKKDGVVTTNVETIYVW